MGVAVEDAHVLSEGSDGTTVLVRHYAGQLMQVVEVVRGPGGEKV